MPPHDEIQNAATDFLLLVAVPPSQVTPAFANFTRRERRQWGRRLRQLHRFVLTGKEARIGALLRQRAEALMNALDPQTGPPRDGRNER